MVFFGVLEIYSREFKPELGWNLSVTQAYLKQKLQKRQATPIIKILKHIQNSGKWDIEFNDDQLTIFIPKFTELTDNWTKRKLRSDDKAPLKKRTLEVEEEVDKEEDNKKKNKFTPPFIGDVINYFLENGYTKEAARKAFEYYEVGNWKDSKGNKVKNWKQKMRGVWFKDENKQPIKYKQKSLEDQLS